MAVHDGINKRDRTLVYVFLGTIVTILAALAYASNGAYGLLILLILAAAGYLLLALAFSVAVRFVDLPEGPLKWRYLPTPTFVMGIFVLSSWGYWFNGVDGIAVVLVAAIVAVILLQGRFEKVRIGVITAIGMGALLLESSRHIAPQTEPSPILYFFLSVIAIGAVWETMLLIGLRLESNGLRLFATIGVAVMGGIAVLASSLVFLRGARLLSVIAVLASLASYLAAIFLTWFVGTILRPQFEILGKVVTQLRVLAPVLVAACLGFILITFIFAGFSAALFRKIPASFRGLPEHATFIDFWYFSAVTCGTLGYGDIVPYTPVAKLLVSIELLTGLAWISVVFGAISVTMRSPDTQCEHSSPLPRENEEESKTLPNSESRTNLRT